MFKFVSRLGAFLLTAIAVDLAHADVGIPCPTCYWDGACVAQFGAGWYYCGTDDDGWYWCCPVGG
ncbi:MAG TPA: hypothetical protein VGN17_17725 [Bryobacteraceae bacterium]|jgi:hypothetical protein